MSAAPSWFGRGGPLRESDYEKLLSGSGIRREWIDRAQLMRVDDAQGRAASGARGSGNYSGLLIPYSLPGETSPREYALRRDTPDIEYDAAGNPKEKRKYLFPPGRGNILYFCPGTTSAQLADNSLPILFVEGVKKALAAHQVAWDAVGDSAANPLVLTLAISGVWNWRGTIGKQTSSDGKPQLLKGPIADLDRIEWRGRKVIVAFDKNVDTHEHVQSARSAFTQQLSKRGAIVHWLHWPANTPISVNGLDDLLALEGAKRIRELIEAALPYRASAPGTRVYTYTELVAADFPAPSPIAKDFLHEGETIGLVGKPKQGKSRLVQQFAIDVSRGRSFLGHEVPKASRVLILDFENRPAVAKQRLLKMDGKPITDNLLVYAPESLMANAITIASEDGVKALVQVVKDVMPDVLIVDNWRLFLAGDENKTDVVLHGLKVLSALRSIVRTLGIIIVHHIRKQQQGEKQVSLRVDPSAWIESASGHYAFVAHVDACFGLERENTGDGNELIIFAGVARNTAPRTLLLDEDEQTLRFRVAEGSDVERLFTPKELEFWRAIRKLDEFSFTDVVNATGTTNRKAVSSMLRKANNMNLVEKRDQLYRRMTH